MRRLFIHSGQIQKDKVVVSQKSQVHHLKDVLRCRRGERFVLCDESGVLYPAAVEQISMQDVSFRIEKKEPAAGKKRPTLAIAVALPKKVKFDDIVDKLTQLGADRIIPMITERTIVRPDSARVLPRLERWRNIARSAAEQSQRIDLPVIDPPKKIAQIVDESRDYGLKFIPALAEKCRTLKEALGAKRSGSIIILIGPEGDFTAPEIESCVKAGFLPVTLGRHVLRVDTAAEAAAGFVMLNSA